jgi:hypothetical protein
MTPFIPGISTQSIATIVAGWQGRRNGERRRRGDDRVKGEERNDSQRSEKVPNKGEKKVRTKKGIYWDFIFIN